MALFFGQKIITSFQTAFKSPDSPNSGHAIYYVVIGGVPSYEDIINCLTRVRRVRRLMNAVWRLVGTF